MILTLLLAAMFDVRRTNEQKAVPVAAFGATCLWRKLAFSCRRRNLLSFLSATGDGNFHFFGPKPYPEFM
jgi:hypothetical protein